MFDSGTDAALKAMTDYVESAHYQTTRGPLLWPARRRRWIRDQFKGLPDEANVYYEQAGRCSRG